MKSFVLGFFVVALCTGALAGEYEKEMQQHMQDCLKENNVSEEDFSTFSSGKMNPADIKDNMKCSFKCFMVKNGYMDESGKVDAAAIMAKHPDHKSTEAALEKCKSISEANPCETAFKITMCVIAEDVKSKHTN